MSSILMIEDDMDFAEAIRLRFEEEAADVTVNLRGFAEGLTDLEEVNPDLIILDIFEGEPRNAKPEGIPVWNHVWNDSFMPLIFASASEYEELREFSRRHPLVRYVLKSDPDAIDSIISSARQLLPYSPGIRTIREALCLDAQRAVHNALTFTAGHALNKIEEIEENLQLLKCASRRRLASVTRLASEAERQHVFAWEQYLVPPPDLSYLLTGDILKDNAKPWDDPDAFRVVLTPSCDLAQGKTSVVLVARCVRLNEFYSKHNLPSPDSKKNQERSADKLASILTQPQSNGYLVLPGLPGYFPPMAACLRTLELVQVKDIATNNGTNNEMFTRVASLDSPFREALTWGYLQVACRPGVPDRNIDAWIEEVLATVKP